jgi:hypothetical protein
VSVEPSQALIRGIGVSVLFGRKEGRKVQGAVALFFEEFKGELTHESSEKGEGVFVEP